MSTKPAAKRPKPGAFPQDSDEDELVSPGRVTPRGGFTTQTNLNSRNRRGEIKKPSTPLRNPSSARSTTSQRSHLTQSLTNARTPVLSKPPRPVPAKRSVPTTPHGLRALKRRAAALTPGRDQRKSGRQKKETPRDILRILARVEAPKTQRVEELPSQNQILGHNEESRSDDSNTDDSATRRLSLSVPIGEDEDSFHDPPRLSMDIDDSPSLGPVEISRRFKGDLGRYGINNPRTSDYDIEFEESQLEEDGDGFPPSHRLNIQSSPEIGPRNNDHSVSGELDDPYESARRDQYQQRSSENVMMSVADDSFALDLPQLSVEPDHLQVRDEGLVVNDISLKSNDFLSFGQRESNLRRASYDRESRPQVRLGDDRVKTRRRNNNLPSGFVKKITRSISKAIGLKKPQISRDVIETIALASDWYFEQIGQDLGVYADHARRQMIDEADVIALMKRQRLLGASTTPFSLAQKFLPRELLQCIGMPPPLLTKRSQNVTNLQF